MSNNELYTVYLPDRDRTHIFMEETKYIDDEIVVDVVFVDWYQGEPNEEDTIHYFEKAMGLKELK